MADLEKTNNDPVAQFWEQLDDVRAGMLGLQGERQHLQPMAPQADPENGEIWFFSKKDSDLVRATGEGRRAVFTVVGRDHDYYASCLGALQQVIDRNKVDELWSPVVAAWFERGRDDPNLMLLRFTPIEAEIWASASDPVTFGWEILKSNLTETTPDVGARNRIEFNAG